ncbi:hypothetical protein SDC9_131268 [bioreactor metagenome]|uniref:Uncharacterized protein n=1 Tax=bioreactor metagenome TaxID=1076179 RepID=A0A645D4S5_9ZZZZ
MRHRHFPSVRLPQLDSRHGSRHGRGSQAEQIPGGRHLLYRRYSGPQAGQIHAGILRQHGQRAGAPRRARHRHQGYGGPAQALCRQEAGHRPEAGGGRAHPLPHPRHLGQPGSRLSDGGGSGRGRGFHSHRLHVLHDQPALHGRGDRRP